LIFRAVEDVDLIRRAARGGVEAYNLLVSRWEKRVYNYLLRITGHREDALDLTQDVFLKAYQNLRKLDDPGRFAPWLYRIAHNEAYSMFRKRRPETDIDELPPESTHNEVTVGRTSCLPGRLSLAVETALGRLSAEQREAVVLRSTRVQVRRMASARLSRLHRQIAVVHGAQLLSRPGSNSSRGVSWLRAVRSRTFPEGLADSDRRVKVI
jgi:RNA polymerase sigma-70 factor (ECF subfamily)